MEARPAVVRVNVRCAGARKDGRICNKLLARVDLARWEETMTDAAEWACDGCGKRYTLKDYK